MAGRFTKRLIFLMIFTFMLAVFSGCSGNKNLENTDNQGNVGNEKEGQDSSSGKMDVFDDENINNPVTQGSDIDISEAKFITDGKLTVGMVIDYPPFEYYAANGETAIGVDVDIIKSVAKELGLEVEIKDVPWDDDLFANIGSKYDVVCSAVTITDERLKDMIFSNPYMDNHQSVVVRSDNKISINSFEVLEGMKVAVQKDTVSDQLMHELFTEDILSTYLVEKEVALDCFEILKAGKVDAIVCDSTVAEGQIARNPEDYVLAYKDDERVEKFAIAIGKDNVGLQKAINEAFDKLETKGSLKAIIDSWFGR